MWEKNRDSLSGWIFWEKRLPALFPNLLELFGNSHSYFEFSFFIHFLIATITLCYLLLPYSWNQGQENWYEATGWILAHFSRLNSFYNRNLNYSQQYTSSDVRIDMIDMCRIKCPYITKLKRVYLMILTDCMFILWFDHRNRARRIYRHDNYRRYNEKYKRKKQKRVFAHLLGIHDSRWGTASLSTELDRSFSLYVWALGLRWIGHQTSEMARKRRRWICQESLLQEWFAAYPHGYEGHQIRDRALPAKARCARDQHLEDCYLPLYH